jgi:hypothetical protein
MKSAVLLATLLFGNQAAYETDSSYGYEPTYKRPSCKPGVIKMHFGYEDYPSGFQKCDGSNDTPDLRDRFPVGAGKDFPFLQTGGSRKIYLNVDQLPSHRHDINADDVSVSEDGKHTHGAYGDIKNAGNHNHDEGTLTTANAGSHAHKFSAESSEDGHEHSFNLVTNAAGNHNHGIDTSTGNAGLHSHDNDFMVEIDGSAHGHDISVKLGAVGDHKHGVTIDDFEISVGDHVHGVGSITAADHYFSHYHNLVDAYTNEAGKHRHNVKTATSNAGDHGHDFDFNTDIQGNHKHDAGSLTTDNAGDHTHNIDEQETKQDGDHDHVFDAYLETSYNTPKDSEGFDVALDKVDKSQGYKQTISKDYGHSHIVPATYTDSAGNHYHDVDGNTGEAGDHYHDVVGKIANAGDHYHQIDTDTSKNGDHSHNVYGRTDEADITLEHDMSGYTAPGGAFTAAVSGLYGKTAGAGSHSHNAYAKTVSNGEHYHALSGGIQDNGVHYHKVKGYTEDNGKHYHRVSGSIGGDDDGEHTHNVYGKTDNDGDHYHKVKGYTGDNGDHTHDIDIYIEEYGKHSHSVYGKTDKTGDGDAIDITPPYLSVKFICCVGDESESSDSYDGPSSDRY